jgi:hypothetical protein
LKGFLRRCIGSSEGPYLHRKTQTKKRHTQPSLTWDSNPQSPVFDSTTTCRVMWSDTRSRNTVMTKNVCVLSDGKGFVHRVPRSRNPVFTIRSSRKTVLPSTPRSLPSTPACDEGSVYLVSKAQNGPTS